MCSRRLLIVLLNERSPLTRVAAIALATSFVSHARILGLSIHFAKNRRMQVAHARCAVNRKLYDGHEEDLLSLEQLCAIFFGSMINNMMIYLALCTFPFILLMPMITASEVHAFTFSED